MKSKKDKDKAKEESGEYKIPGKKFLKNFTIL